VPELPEVETVVRDLRVPLVGRTFRRVAVSEKALRRRWSPAWARQLTGRTVRAIERRGKWILIDLGGPWLVVHLGMSGQFTVAPADAPRASHTHVVFKLDDGNELRFRDIRRFGSVSFVLSRAELDGFLEDCCLGPEPFDLDARAWRERLAGTRRNLKAILLDQTVVAGVGNIYADESLFEARLDPRLPGAELTPAQADRLRRAIPKVLNRAIERRGSSIRNYVGGSGLKGGYQDEFRVYGRTGRPCPRCGTPVERIRLAGRSTHFCPRCQKRA
jgi:formamidopyrimidine-DNA glycosylase